MHVRDKPHPHREFGARLKASRTRRHLTQADVAALSGASVHMIRQYEQGRCLPTALRLHHLCVALKVTTADLFEHETGETHQ